MTTGPGSVRIAFETARLRLAQIQNEGIQARVSAYRAACKQSAQTLSVECVSVWFFSDDASQLSCALYYTASTDEFNSGQSLSRAASPQYFDAIRSRRVVVACDAETDPKTVELGPYLSQRGIGALLDAPIYRDGRVIGVVCHEHVGGARDWSEREAGFACAVADLLTILIHQAEASELRAAIEAQRQQQAQSQKMEALVRLARVVVHDLSNVLTIASLRVGEMPREVDVQSASVDVLNVLDYGGKLLQQLRDFCDQREAQALVEAVDFLRNMQATLQTLLGRDISLHLQCDVAAAQLAMPPIELEQLVLNLCMNAKDAISAKGEVKIVLALQADHLQLDVHDTGIGMDEATQQRLFEPFYSTKSGHSGIGLSAVYGIVERARGHIDVSSILGKGSTFRITLPLHRPRASVEPPWVF